MAQGKSRDPRKEQQWRRWIQQWQQSRLSVRDFCVRYDLAEPTFYAWRRQLQHQALERGDIVRQVLGGERRRDSSRVGEAHTYETHQGP